MTKKLIINNLDEFNEALSSKYSKYDLWIFNTSFDCKANDYVNVINQVVTGNTLTTPLPSLVFQDMPMPARRFSTPSNTESVQQQVKEANFSKEHEALLTTLGLRFVIRGRSGAKRSLFSAIDNVTDDEEKHKDKRPRL